jgi:hypothetical protein
MEKKIMRNTRLTDNIKIVVANIPTATGTALASTVVDCTGFARATYVLTTGTAGTGATLDLKITESDASGGSYTDVTSAALVQIADTGGSKTYIIDCPVKSTMPFQKTVLAAAVGTFAASCSAILYKQVSSPVLSTYATQHIKV